MTRILLVSGSTDEQSLHTAALRTAARSAPPGIAALLYDGLRHLPAFVPGERNPPETVLALRHEVTVADALLFCTPEYAGSLPGSLKNLLDWLVAGGELGAKPATWLSVSAPGQDEGAVTALRTVLEHGNARVLSGASIRIPLSREIVDADGLVDDERLSVALLDMVQSLVRSLAGAQTRQRPSWQAYSSVFPVVQRRDAPDFRKWQP